MTKNFLGITRVALFLAAIFLSELLLKGLNTPVWFSILDYPALPFLEPDLSYGWRNKAGIYELVVLDGTKRVVKKTFWEGGRRSTGPNEPALIAHEVVLLGDSFVQGYGLADEETLGWKLQALRSEFAVTNYGTGGYGTVQPFLWMKNTSRGETTKRIVIYGFNHFHEERNVASPTWARGILPTMTKVKFPYAVIDAGASLQIGATTPEPPWVASRYLRIIALLDEVIYHVRGYQRLQTRRQVTERLLQEMARYAKDQESKFYVLLQEHTDESLEHYASFFREAQIEFFDCQPRYAKQPEFAIPDGHPNGAMNEIWAKCISANIQPL